MRTFPPISVIALVVVGVLLCAAMAYALRDPDVVPSVTVDNPSELDVNVSVHPAGNDGSLILATVPPTGSATNLDVLDQGDDWVFTFSSGGIDGGSLRVPRGSWPPMAGVWRSPTRSSAVCRTARSFPPTSTDVSP